MKKRSLFRSDFNFSFGLFYLVVKRKKTHQLKETIQLHQSHIRIHGYHGQRRKQLVQSLERNQDNVKSVMK